MMGTLSAEKVTVLSEVFDQYDIYKAGELTAVQLQSIHSDMRVGGISIPQVEESIRYTCIDDVCEKSEFYDVLQEMDRRYFLIQDFCWEFSMLDGNKTNTITEDQARWFVEMVHGAYFSGRRWERFLRSRAVPGSGVTFSEIEVRLCNIPSRDDWLQDQEDDRKEREEQERLRREHERILEGEREKRKHQREEDRKKKSDDDTRRKLEDDHLRQEEQDERRKRQLEREEAERRKQRLQDEEERGRKEAEEREKTEKEKADSERKKKEEEELERLRQLEEKHRLEEEARRQQELKEASDYEAILRDTERKELEAHEEEEKHRKRINLAGDNTSRKDALEAEHRAKLKRKEFKNKRIRYNLKVAIKRRDREKLPKAVDDFKKAQLPDDDMDLAKAERLLKEFKARDGLKHGMKGRDLKQLEQAMNFVRRNGFELQLEREMVEAHKVLLQLRRLERIRAEILELKQSTVAEIRSYQNPPPVVHTVMTGTFLVLGHKEKETKVWKNVQALVGKTGKEGLKRRCLECDPGKVDEAAAARAKALLDQFELDDVRDVSAGAATFYLWSWTMIEESEHRREELKRREEKRKRKLEEKKRENERQEAEREERRRLGLDVDDEPPSPDPPPVPPASVPPPAPPVAKTEKQATPGAARKPRSTTPASRSNKTTPGDSNKRSASKSADRKPPARTRESKSPSKQQNVVTPKSAPQVNTEQSAKSAETPDDMGPVTTGGDKSSSEQSNQPETVHPAGNTPENQEPPKH